MGNFFSQLHRNNNERASYGRIEKALLDHVPIKGVNCQVWLSLRC